LNNSGKPNKNGNLINIYFFSFLTSEVSSEVKHTTTLWFHHWPCGSQDNKKGERNNTAQRDNKTHRKHKYSESKSKNWLWIPQLICYEMPHASCAKRNWRRL